MTDIQFQHVQTTPSSWLGVPATALGTSRDRSGYVLVTEDGIPRHRLDLCYSGPEAWFRVAAIDWRGIVVVGFGERFYFLPRLGSAPTEFKLRAYFCDFHAGDEWLLIASGQDVTCVDCDGVARWQSEIVALDGVIIERVEHGVIYGEGEWDPPGGWREFRLLLSDGRTIVPK